MAISTEKESTSYYLEDGILSEIPSIKASNCSAPSAGGKYLMIALGPEVIEFEDNVRGLNFNGNFGAKKCELTDNPFSRPATHETRENKFNEEWKLIKSCIDVIVEDEGPRPLEAPEKQVGCELRKLSKNKASFNGGFCFFKPNFGSTYKVRLQAKSECTSKAAIAKLSLKTYELLAGINFYTSGDASGSSVNLTALSNTKIKLTINPLKNILSSSEDYGLNYPTWPEIWSMPDVHFSRMKLNKTGNDRIEIEMPMLVDNNCSARCSDGVCQSACDYSQPIVGEFSLYELIKGKVELITSWHDGGIAPGKFQGIIKGLKNEVPQSYFESGKTFRIEAVFIDPKYDYEIFKKRIRSILNNFRQRIGSIGNSGIPGIQPIPPINDSRSLPSLGKIPDLVFDRSINEIDRQVELLRSYLSYRLWPPFYTNLCHEDRCVPTNDGFMSLSVDFKIKDNISENELTYEVINISRKSLLVPEYEKIAFPNPEVRCTETDIEEGI